MKTQPPEHLLKVMNNLYALMIHPATPHHEREEAGAALRRRLAAYGWTLDDLQAERPSLYTFRYQDQDEKKLLLGIIGAVQGWDNSEVYKGRKRQTLIAPLTQEQSKQVAKRFIMVRAVWRKEKEALRYAIMDKAGILKPASDDQPLIDNDKLARLLRHLANTPDFPTDAPQLPDSNRKD